MVRMYLSTARPGLSTDDLQHIVDVSRRQNAAARVSGVLLFGNGRFLQLLEGPGPAVERTYRRVLGDQRHRDAVLVYDGKGEPLRFTQWAMGFLRAELVGHLPSVVRLMDLATDEDSSPLRAEAALRMFLELRRELARDDAATQPATASSEGCAGGRERASISSVTRASRSSSS